MAFSAQLARAAVHECSAMRAGEAMAESFRNLPHSLAAWIRVFPPMIVLRRDDALLGTVPAAQFTAAYLRHKWWHRALDPAAPIHDASFLDAHRRQVVALIELDLPISVPELPAAVLTAYSDLGRVIGDAAVMVALERPVLPASGSGRGGMPCGHSSSVAS